MRKKQFQVAIRPRARDFATRLQVDPALGCAIDRGRSLRFSQISFTPNHSDQPVNDVRTFSNFYWMVIADSKRHRLFRSFNNAQQLLESLQRHLISENASLLPDFWWINDAESALDFQGLPAKMPPKGQVPHEELL
jgi:hypothetical protein